MGLFGRMMAYGAYYTASETLARPGRCQGLSFFASRSLFAGGMAFGTSCTAGGDARARAPTMACCQHGESPCGGYTLTPKSKLTASSRGGVGSKLR